MLSAPDDELTDAYLPNAPAGDRFSSGSLLAGRYRVVALLAKGGVNAFALPV
jgi:hypothetical protein